jgi:hypothetical protein
MEVAIALRVESAIFGGSCSATNDQLRIILGDRCVHVRETKQLALFADPGVLMSIRTPVWCSFSRATSIEPQSPSLILALRCYFPSSGRNGYFRSHAMLHAS